MTCPQNRFSTDRFTVDRSIVERSVLTSWCASEVISLDLLWVESVICDLVLVLLYTITSDMSNGYMYSMLDCQVSVVLEKSSIHFTSLLKRTHRIVDEKNNVYICFISDIDECFFFKSAGIIYFASFQT